MRIDRLQLVAYGPFTDTALDFSQGQGVFHLIYGPNEAGKSSALRALRGLLFGIPFRTLDNFRHPNRKLRIGATLTRSDGRQIAFVRRKGRQKTLRGEDDQTLLAETALRPFLGGLDRDLFEQMFAIDHADLVRGGEEIIAGAGSVGQALFAAGAGLLQLQDLQQRLDAECEALFKTAGKNPTINRTLALLKTARQNQKTAVLQTRTWQTHHDALTDAKRRLEEVQQALAAKHQRRGLLQRIHEALPLIARHREIDAALETLTDLPELPDDFSRRRRETEYTLKTAANDFRRSQAIIEDIQKQIKALDVPATLLDHAALVEALQHDLGSFTKAQEDRPRLEARMHLLYRQASDGLSEAGTHARITNDNGPALPAALAAEISELGQTHERLKVRLDAAAERRRQLETEIQTLGEQREALAAPSEIKALQTALQTAQEAGPLEKQLATARHEISLQENNLSKGLQRQTLWNGTLDAIATLALPPPETIDQFENRWDMLTRRHEELQAEVKKKDAELSSINIELHTIATSHDVPTESNLKKARNLRGRGWQLIRNRLEGRRLDPVEEERFAADIKINGRLPDAFEASVHRADQIADRLRREAGQVSRKSLLEARKTQYDDERQTIATAVEEVRETLSEWDGQWRKLWAPVGIEPSSTREMRAWLSAILSIREHCDTLRSHKAKANAIETETDVLKKRLAKGLRQTGQATDESDSLAHLITAARTHVALQEKRQLQIASIEKERQKLVQAHRGLLTEIAGLEEALRDWRNVWSQKVADIGLKGDARPGAATAVIESIRVAKAQYAEADILRKRIHGIDRDAGVFRRRVGDLVAQLAPELKGQSLDRAAPLLNARLNAAREAQTARRSLEQQQIKARTSLTDAQKRQDDAEALIQALCREAGGQVPEALPEIENRNAKRRHLMDEKEGLANQLRHLSAGETVEAFIAEAAAIKTDAIASDLARLAEDIQTLEREREDLNQTIGTERAELKHMDGRAAAAGHAEEGERLLASLEADVEKYARFKLAAVILTRTIEQYRDRHQGPLIMRASTLFARMTAGAFSGVRAEYDEKGHPVLVGIRSDGNDQVAVAGMSDGTADQLYLALRLASIEQYLDNSESLPFIADDILLRFDDERSAATLEVLAELAGRTQVIFFTHHQYMLDLACRTVDDALLQVHRLQSRPPSAA
jgi:uncharacterized protein YhaN